MIKKITKILINEKWLHLIIGGIIINSLCFLMYFVSSAESSNSLPFIVQNENIPDYNYYMEALEVDISNYNSWAKMPNELEVCFGYDYFESGKHRFAYYYPVNSNSSYEFTLSTSYDNFDYTIDTATIHLIGSWIKIDGYRASSNIYSFYGSYNDVNNIYIAFFYGTNKGNGSLLVPNIATTNFNYDNDIYKPVFGFGVPVPPVIPNGHATPPNEFENPLSTSDHDLPREVPNYPTINNYSWTTYNNPPINTTNLESLVGSLIDIVKYNFNYLFTNLSGLFNNLLSNLKNFFEYIASVIEYYGGLIISNIQNAITTFYNNMISLGESISQTLTAIHDLLTNPLDTALLNTQLNNSSFVGAIRTTESQITNFFGLFSDISQPDNIIFEIDLRDLWFNGGVAYLDFSIISPILPFIRLVLGCILLYSLIVTIVTNINSYIGGNGAKNDSEG